MSTVALEDYVTVNEAAEILGCTEGRIRQLRLSGQLVGVKFGRSWALVRSSVKRYASLKHTRGRPRVHAQSN